MKKFIVIGVLAAGLTSGANVRAGTGYAMRCGVEPAAEPASGQAVRGCGYRVRVTFGGGMFFSQITAYCSRCQGFVYLSWTPDRGLPEGMPRREATPPPTPLGQVWDPVTGRTLTLYACPRCDGPSVEIKRLEDLVHCPACGAPGFEVDPTAPVIAID